MQPVFRFQIGELLYHENIICLTGEPLGRYARRRRKEGGDMVTYADLIQYTIMLCAVITLVIYATRQK